jgi:hypothetical protein
MQPAKKVSDIFAKLEIGFSAATILIFFFKTVLFITGYCAYIQGERIDRFHSDHNA